jgi:hypothetical protein
MIGLKQGRDKEKVKEVTYLLGCRDACRRLGAGRTIGEG